MIVSLYMAIQENQVVVGYKLFTFKWYVGTYNVCSPKIETNTNSKVRGKRGGSQTRAPNPLSPINAP
jgi:hypothetical protein